MQTEHYRNDSGKEKKGRMLMKKFLSLVLTLALTLSLVVLPARADEEETGGTISGTVTLGVGGTSELTVTPEASYTDGSDTYTLKAEGITYTWSSNDATKATVSGNTAKAAVAAGAVGNTTVKCSVTATYVKTGEPATEQQKTYVASTTVRVKSLADCLDKITLNGRTYAADKEIKESSKVTLAKSNFTAVTLKSGSPYATPTWEFENNELTVSAKAVGADTETLAQTAKVTVTPVSDGTVTIAGEGNTIHTDNGNYIRAGEAGVLKATFTKQLGTYTENVTYKWYQNGSETAVANASGETFELKDLAAGSYTFKVEAYEGTTKVATYAEYSLTVKPDTYAFAAATYDSKMTTGFKQMLNLVLKNNGTVVNAPAGDISIVWTVKSGDGDKISLASSTTTSNAGIEVTAGTTSGTAVVYATPTYQNKIYPQVAFTITIAALDKTLTDIENGDYDSYSLSTLKEYAASVINGVYSSKILDDDDIQHIYIGSSLPSSSKLVLYDDSDCESSDKYAANDEITGTLYVKAVAGFLGTESFKLKVKTNESSNSEYIITFFVESTADETINATVSAEENGTKVTFTFPDDYAFWYVYTGSSSFKDSMYSNYSSPNGSWSSKKKADETYSALKVSEFDDGDVTLYVVGLDSHGVASTGKLTVSLDAHDIEYSGVAGETITFNQDDFDEFLEDTAEDSGLIGKKGSTAYVKFKNVVFTVPTEKTQGILYNNGTKITSKTTKCTDLDNVTFAIASKASNKVLLKFTLTYDYYKDDKSGTKATEKTMSGRVLVSVVSEDIKYTVPVDGTVTFKPYDFEDFYTDTYKNGTLSYVKFTELPKVADGALYATYSTLYAGTLAKTSDKFYYDSSKITDLDLDDVTFRTSLWSKTGTKVYLPFEAYGTTTKNSKTVSSTPVKGCVVITITAAKTMNFTDVTTAEWFYDNVKKAYTMGLIEGKTATTFNPNDNMTYAEAVTLAARMNELYNTRKITLENSKTGNWYSSYESYAISKGIISSALGNKANTKITRRDYVEIFYNALPATDYVVRNSITKIPDLANDSTNAKIYTFYKAGILTGYANTPGKTTGSFGANDNIKRSEVATILIRMMDSSTRMYFTL